MEIISIIIPTYNVGEYLNKCLNSIEVQSFKDFVVYIIDDVSTDNTVDIIKKYMEKDFRFKGILKENNSGPSISRNMGLEVAKGEFVVFVDADDWFADVQALDTYVSIMKKGNYDCVCCGYLTIHNAARLVKKVKNKYLGEKNAQQLLLDKMKNDDPYYHYIWNKCYKRSVIEENNLLFEPHKNSAEDVLFNNEFLCVAKKYFLISNPMYAYNCMNQNSLTRCKKKSVKDTQIEMNERWNIIFKDLNYNYDLAKKLCVSNKAYRYIDRLIYIKCRYFFSDYANRDECKTFKESKEWSKLLSNIRAEKILLDFKYQKIRIFSRIKQSVKIVLQRIR